MKKIQVLFCMCFLFFTACRKIADKTENQTETALQTRQQTTRCGMEEAMAAVSPQLRSEMAKRAVAARQSAELLVFLDFDGAFVRRGFGSAQGGNVTSPIISGGGNCPAPSLSAEQITTIIEMVQDDFSPFNILFTTEQSVYDAYPTNNKQVCIITTFPSVIGFSNGVAGVSPFAGLNFRLSNNPCFVFASVFGNNLAEIANTISHEVGHTFGLGHQSLYSESCNFNSEYHPGFGTGPVSFAPLMGSGFNKRISNWFAQPCIHPLYGGPQNDFVFLQNQVEVKADDFPNQSGGGSMMSASGITGVLEEAEDVDFIRINFRSPGTVTISSDNIDLKVSLYLPNGKLLGEYENADDTHVTIPSANGMRYLKIEAVSNANMSSQFMTGQYKISF